MTSVMEHQAKPVMGHGEPYLLDIAVSAPLPELEPLQEKTVGVYASISLSKTDAGAPKATIVWKSRVVCARLSGRTYQRIKVIGAESFFLSSDGIMVNRSKTKHGGSVTSHVWASSENNSGVPVYGTIMSAIDHIEGFVRANPDATHTGWIEPSELTRDWATQVSGVVSEHMGPAPLIHHRYPLLYLDAGLMSGHRNKQLSISTRALYLDCKDHSEVAKKMFGRRHHLRPMNRLVEELGPHRAHWFALFRGLVPADWIVDSMRKSVELTNSPAENPYWRDLSRADSRLLRKVLSLVPRSVLRRILKGGLDNRATIALGDMALLGRRDFSLLPLHIAATGAKNVKTASDLERIIFTLPVARTNTRRDSAQSVRLREREAFANHSSRGQVVEHALSLGVLSLEHQRLVADIEKSEPWQWVEGGELHEKVSALCQGPLAQRPGSDRLLRGEGRGRLGAGIRSTAGAVTALSDLGKAVHGATLSGGYTVKVAKKAEELAQWGVALEICIGSYWPRLRDSILFAVSNPSGALKLAAIAEDGVVTQFLGWRNGNIADRVGDDAQRIVDGLNNLGLRFRKSTIGIRGLEIPEHSLEQG